MKNWHPVKIMSSPAIKEFGLKKKKVFKSNPKPGWGKKSSFWFCKEEFLPQLVKACSPPFVLTSPQDGRTAGVFRGLSHQLQADGRFQELMHLAGVLQHVRALIAAMGQDNLQNNVFPSRQFGLSGLREVSRSLLLPVPSHRSTSEKSLERTSGNVFLHKSFGLVKKWESST